MQRCYLCPRILLKSQARSSTTKALAATESPGGEGSAQIVGRRYLKSLDQFRGRLGLAQDHLMIFLFTNHKWIFLLVDRRIGIVWIRGFPNSPNFHQRVDYSYRRAA